MGAVVGGIGVKVQVGAKKKVAVAEGIRTILLLDAVVFVGVAF